MKSVGILNHKGGVGKTFIAAHLLWCLRDFYHKKVYGIDGDSQSHLLKWIKGKDYSSGDVEVKDIYVKYGHGQRDFGVPREFDYVIYDDRPTIEDFVRLIRGLDLVFIPVFGRMAIESALDVKVLINEIGLRDNVYIIRNRIKQDRLGMTRLEDHLLAGLNGKVVDGGIIETDLIRLAEDLGVPVWRIKGQGYNRSGVTPFFLRLCEIIINEKNRA